MSALKNWYPAFSLIVRSANANLFASIPSNTPTSEHAYEFEILSIDPVVTKSIPCLVNSKCVKLRWNFREIHGNIGVLFHRQEVLLA